MRGVERAWLVFGVDDKRRAVVGTDYRMEPERLQGLKQQIAHPIWFLAESKKS